ncbi:MAG: hypothetical protein Q7S16_04135 [bacterium]|nr:hypothetical protein [bacterium]
MQNLLSDILAPFISTFSGILFAFYLDRRIQHQLQKKTYKNLLHALRLELENNKLLVDRKEWIPVSFETFKLAFGNEVFVEGVIEDYGENFVKELWDVISGLRKMKADSEKGVNTRVFDVFVSQYNKSVEYKKLEKIIQRIVE